MELTWKIFGHEGVKNILHRQLLSGKFSHAYLFFGPEGVGKKALALEYVKKILDSENIFSHPDFFLLDESKEITLDKILEFSEQSVYKPFIAKKKISVINNAQLINVQAANALLKTLEETKESNLIILIASQPLLSTIESRCQKLNFNAFSMNALKELFVKNYGEPPNAEFLEFANGSWGRLESLVKNPDFFAEQKAIIQDFVKLLGAPNSEKLLAVNKFSVLEPEVLQKYVLGWIAWHKLQLKKTPQNYVKIAFLTKAWKQIINGSYNKKLILQELFLNL